MTIKVTDIKLSHLNFTDLEENQRSKGQKISYPRYTHPDNGSEVPLFIQFPWIDMKSYGVPRIGEFYADDSQRSFIKVPLDQSNPEIKQLSDIIRQIDKKCSSEEFKEKMFGSKSTKYSYQPIYRLPLEEDEDNKKEGKKDYGPKQPYMKLKIDTTHPDNQIKTILFNSILKDGKRIRTKIENVNTVDDFASHVCWLSRIRPVVRPVKLWAQAPNKRDPTYGITFKIAKSEVEAPIKTVSNVKEFMESDIFIDSDEESDIIETVAPIKSAESVPSTIVNGKQVAQIVSDDESDEESDDEQIITKPSTAKAKEVSDSEESDEEVKPVKKLTAKASKTASKSKKNTS